MKFKRCVYKYRQLINSSIRNTEQHQLLEQFLHEGNHSALTEILPCDLAKKVVQQKKMKQYFDWIFCLLLEMKTISYPWVV